MKHPLACALALALAAGSTIAAPPQAKPQGNAAVSTANASNPFFADSTLHLDARSGASLNVAR